MDDLIYRQDALKTYQDIVCKGICCSDCRAVDRDGNCVVEDWLKALPSAPQWIPCSERLPEENGRYLCTYSDFGVCVDFGLYTDGQWIIEPIAWMPLPEPWRRK